MKLAQGAEYDALVEKHVDNMTTLVQDPYGNYAVQFILDCADPQTHMAMFSKIKGHMAALSMFKFASNAIEKGLRAEPAYAESTGMIIGELVSSDKAKELIHSPYGNYVVQKALAMPHPMTIHLANVMQPHIPALRFTTYGKKLCKLVRQARATAEALWPDNLPPIDFDSAPQASMAPSPAPALSLTAPASAAPPLSVATAAFPSTTAAPLPSTVPRPAGAAPIHAAGDIDSKWLPPAVSNDGWSVAPAAPLAAIPQAPTPASTQQAMTPAPFLGGLTQTFASTSPTSSEQTFDSGIAAASLATPASGFAMSASAAPYTPMDASGGWGAGDVFFQGLSIEDPVAVINAGTR